MPTQQPTVTTSDGKRTFACAPAAVLVFIVNEKEELLLLAHPKRGGSWEVINGALEAGESILQGAHRETLEEAGPDIQVRPLGTVHISTFHYDVNVQFMLSIGYLMAYEGGPVQPGDDMVGSQYKWWSLDDLSGENVNVLVPPGGMWLLERAVELYRLWNGKEQALQPELVVPSDVKPK
jgi:8-oxo-dGTP pyrophosphatase MutT (NUDIX family)